MGLFGTIMEKLGFGAAAHAATPPPAAAPASAAPSAPAAAAPAALRPAAMSAVDVVGKLEGLAAKNSQKLNWKSSIVDLMKLLNLDSSLTARKELATELGCPADKMGDSAQMNMWLHKAVLQKLAANGGNIPKELLH
jgi:pyruvate/2-oxoglutarate dehydrogenase complex dihydrolipoamide acyltransferase (E2) component